MNGPNLFMEGLMHIVGAQSKQLLPAIQEISAKAGRLRTLGSSYFFSVVNPEKQKIYSTFDQRDKLIKRAISVINDSDIRQYFSIRFLAAKPEHQVDSMASLDAFRKEASKKIRKEEIRKSTPGAPDTGDSEYVKNISDKFLDVVITHVILSALKTEPNLSNLESKVLRNEFQKIASSKFDIIREEEGKPITFAMELAEIIAPLVELAQEVDHLENQIKILEKKISKDSNKERINTGENEAYQELKEQFKEELEAKKTVFIKKFKQIIKNMGVTTISDASIVPKPLQLSITDVHENLLGIHSKAEISSQTRNVIELKILYYILMGLSFFFGYHSLSALISDLVKKKVVEISDLAKSGEKIKNPDNFINKIEENIQLLDALKISIDIIVKKIKEHDTSLNIDYKHILKLQQELSEEIPKAVKSKDSFRERVKGLKSEIEALINEREDIENDKENGSASKEMALDKIEEQIESKQKTLHDYATTFEKLANNLSSRVLTYQTNVNLINEKVTLEKIHNLHSEIDKIPNLGKEIKDDLVHLFIRATKIEHRQQPNIIKDDEIQELEKIENDMQRILVENRPVEQIKENTLSKAQRIRINSFVLARTFLHLNENKVDNKLTN